MVSVQLARTRVHVPLTPVPVLDTGTFSRFN